MRGLCRPEDRSKKDTKGFELAKQALLCYSAIFLLHSCTLVCCCQLDCLEISHFTVRLVIAILVIWITNVRQLLAHQWKEQTQNYFIIVFKIIRPISVVHFPYEISQKAHSIPTGLAITNFQISVPLSFISLLFTVLKFSPTKPTSFSPLCKNFSCDQTSQNLPNFSVPLQFIINQYALILSKQTLIS